MSISGINNYNYPNYYAGARHNMAKTGGRDSGVLSSTSSASSNITLHMSDGGNSGNALTAMGFRMEPVHLSLRQMIIIRQIRNIESDIGIKKEITQIQMYR